MSNIIRVSAEDAEAVDEYVLYHRIVGDDDNGHPFTPTQYEAYKRRVFPMRLKNRISSTQNRLPLHSIRKTNTPTLFKM
ncbi:hypothetical protein ACTXT7_011871 [Hymenolepis weldensis]